MHVNVTCGRYIILDCMLLQTVQVKMDYVLLVTFVLLPLQYIRCANITQVESLYADLFDSYNRKLFPLINHNDSVSVRTSVAIASINNFDELTGEIELALVFSMQWIDERLKWTPSGYGGKSTLLVPSDDIWRPQFYVIQSFDKIQEVGNMSILTRIHYSGTIYWNTGNVMKLLCSVDVTYFPFDTQFCVITVAGWTYTNDEILFYTTDSTLNQDMLSSNSQWELNSATVNNYTSRTHPPSINIKLTLGRRSNFFIVYIIIPIIFLGSINNLVFVMPASSGERMSVAITTFLSFVVYMEMINDNVPKSSSPVAYIYYYILFLMLYSSTIILLCIVSLRIHAKDGEVPKLAKQLTTYLQFWCLTRRRKTGDIPQGHISVTSGGQLPELENRPIHVKTTNDPVSDIVPEVTWKEVGKTYDIYCFVALSLTFWIKSIFTFSSLYNNNGI